ncbi:MAG: PEP-CTERM sorting domain-containing protein [Chthoniobacterales bacterium]
MSQPKQLRHRTASLATSRWTAYATACAATALVGVYNAEGDITYSGPINQTFNAAPGAVASAFFQLGPNPGNSINPYHLRTSGGTLGAAQWFMYGVVSGAIAGFAASGYNYASRLNLGQGINSRPFVLNQATLAAGNGYGNSQFLTAGTAFLGFRFNTGAGMQYGWARITMDGSPGNSFTLVDYAFGDVGDMITAGQTAAIPEPGSLGLLALGGLGLVAWRRQRGKTAATQEA